MIDTLRPFAVIGAAVLAAAICPWAACSDCNAPLHPEVTVFWIVIPLIFLFEGLSLPTSAVFSAAGRYGLHATVLAYNFAFIPLAILAMVSLQDFFFPFARGLRDGYLALAAVPTTTSMCVMHSNASGANAPLAAFAALLANVVAVVLTPLLLSTMCRTSTVQYASLILSVAGKMVVPLCIGQALRPSLGPLLSAYQPTVQLINKALISCLLLQIFSDIFFWGVVVSPLMLALMLPSVVLLHLLFLRLSWALGGLLQLSTPDRVPFMFSASQKTVVLGLPLLRATFADRANKEQALVLLPLICYHIFTLIFGLAIAPRLRALISKEQMDNEEGEGGGSRAGECKLVASAEADELV